MEEEKELKISSKLYTELDNNEIKNNINNLIDFNKIIENYLSREDLTEEQKSRISEKMKGITEIYLKLVKINKMHRSNAEKSEKMKAVLSELTKGKLMDVVTTVQDIDKEIEELDKQIQQALDILHKAKAERTQEVSDQIRSNLAEYAASAKSTITRKKETTAAKEEQTNNKEETALTVKEEKKKGFFAKIKENFNKVADAAMDSPLFWDAVHTERDGKTYVTYIDMQTDEIKAEYELTGDEKEDKKRDNKAKSLFSRIGKALGKEEKVESYAEREKRNAIDEQIKGIGDIATDGLYDYAEKNLRKVVDKAKGKAQSVFRDVVQKISKSYVWAEKLSGVLEKQEQEIDNKIARIQKERNALQRSPAEFAWLQDEIKLSQELITVIQEKLDTVGSDKIEEVKADLAKAIAYHDKMAREYKQEKGLDEFFKTFSDERTEEIQKSEKTKRTIQGIRKNVDSIGTHLKKLGTKEKTEKKVKTETVKKEAKKPTRAEVAARER